MKNYFEKLGVFQPTVDFVKNCEGQIHEKFAEIDAVAEYNQLKVLHAMQENRLSDVHFNWNTGYGYDDAGRDGVESVFKTIFATEDAIVRPIIVSGTHALTLMLTGILRPGQRMVSITGRPYDTLESVIGIKPSEGLSLIDIGVHYEEIELTASGHFDVEAIRSAIDTPVDVIYIQRSAGYAWRGALSVSEIGDIITFIKKQWPNCIVMIDNCYGEFLEIIEPTEVGADIAAGSLIKNPGGGQALSGGYIVGKKCLIDRVAARMTSPGIGKECGLTFGQTRSMLQGLFMAPTVVGGALKGAILCAQVFKNLGYAVNPEPNGTRSDIIQAIRFESPEKVIEFCKGIQAAAPVNSFVSPEPWDMPGYSDQVIMAAGAFVQGSSIELSADAPIREPYVAYFQGGLTYEHSKFGVIKALDALVKKALVVLPEN
jgi:cystathionine beta-lyase family protein involved in aluminum resistance